MSRKRVSLAALAALSLGGCSRELGPLSAETSLPRPAPRWEVRHADGDGSVGWVLARAVAALRDTTYRCYVTGGPLRGGKVVANRHYILGSGDAATEVEILTVNGDLFTRSVEYRDRSDRPRLLHDSKNRPMMGADTVAARLFAAADAAPCPSPANPPPVETRSADGDGAVEWVLDATLAALRDGTYRCVARVSPLRDGDTLTFRFYHISSGDDATLVSFSAKGGDRRRSVHYTDQSGQRRAVGEGKDRPLLGADSIATRIFAAAAAAPCPAEN